MTQPLHHLAQTGGFKPRAVQLWSCNHDNRQRQGAGGVKFSARGNTPSIFADHKLNIIVTHQGQIALFGKRPSGHHDIAVWQRKLFGKWVHKAQQIAVLRLRLKSLQMHSAQRKHYSSFCPLQRRNSIRDISNLCPIIRRNRFPFWPAKCHQWKIEVSAGINRMLAHLNRKWMCGINYMCNRIFAQILFQPLNPSKSSYAAGQGLWFGSFHTPGIGQNRLYFCGINLFGKLAGLSRTCKYQKVYAHV